MYHPQLTRIARTSFRPVFLNPIFSRAYTVSAPANKAAANRKAKNNNDEKDPDNVARGLKAALHNSKVSSGAKDHAVEQLKQIDDRNKEVQNQMEMAFVRHQLGYKSTLSSNRTSKNAKKHAKTVLDSVAKGEIKDVKDVMGGGYNASLKNRYTSPEARHQAEKGLKEHKVKL